MEKKCWWNARKEMPSGSRSWTKKKTTSKEIFRWFCGAKNSKKGSSMIGIIASNGFKNIECNAKMGIWQDSRERRRMEVTGKKALHTRCVYKNAIEQRYCNADGSLVRCFFALRVFPSVPSLAICIALHRVYVWVHCEINEKNNFCMNNHFVIRIEIWLRMHQHSWSLCAFIVRFLLQRLYPGFSTEIKISKIAMLSHNCKNDITSREFVTAIDEYDVYRYNESHFSGVLCLISSPFLLLSLDLFVFVQFVKIHNLPTMQRQANEIHNTYIADILCVICKISYDCRETS